MQKNYHSLGIKIVLKELETSEKGLKQEEAAKRLKQYGQNKLPKEKPLSQTKIFLSQFQSPLIFILLFAGAISFVLKELIDAGVIFSAVLINTIIGFIQESKANNTLSKLRSLVEYESLAIRNGVEILVKAEDLVAGDLIIIKAGNRIPADARLIEAADLQINEAPLTGESMPAHKNTNPVAAGASLADRFNMIYAGTTAVRGSGQAIITAIGANTEIGKIASLVRETEEEKTPLQKRLADFSRFLGIGLGFISILVFIVGLWQGREPLEMFIMSIALAVSSIPEGLIIGVTVILTLGMQQILKRNALTRKLVAAETLGSTTVICTDKTGTLTEGKMHVSEIIIENLAKCDLTELNNNNKSDCAEVFRLALIAAMLCNEAIAEDTSGLGQWSIIGSPTDSALMSAAIQAGLNKKDLLRLEPRLAELPFNSENKYMLSLHQKGKDYILYEKGAAEKLLAKSSFFYDKDKVSKLTLAKAKKLNADYEALTEKGLRVIGVAIKRFKKLENNLPEREEDWKLLDQDLTFIGFIALKDPLRPEAKETIKICQQAGIRPVIITGDHKLTAKTIALEVGIKVKAENIIEGFELDKIDDQKLKKLVKQINVYARVSPHHKLRIVRALIDNGEVVAMTGDGINDSPALKAADIGIALGGGTDIAKEASDIVLLDNNFKTIVTAIKEGRIIFANIRKVIIYLISDSFSEFILIVGSILLGMPLALIPVQILWINIINDGLPNFALAFERDERGIMTKKPLSKHEPILNQEMKIIIFAAGLARDFIAFGVFLYLFKHSFDLDYTRTLLFAMLGVDSLVYIFSLRSLNTHIWKMNPFSNPVLILSVIVSFWLLIASIYFPFFQKILSTVYLDLRSWGIVLGAAFFSIITIELVKHKFINKN